MTKRPVGLTWNLVSGVRSAAGMTGRMTSSMIASRSDACLIDLGLAVGPQEVELALAARLREALHQPVRERQRQRHELLGLPDRVAEHHSLVAGAAGVHALSDVGGLRIDRRHDRAGLVVEAELRARVADLLDRLADDRRQVHVRARRDLARDERETRRHERLARDAADGVVAEHRVEDRVGDLVGDLVGMPLGHRLRGKEVPSGLEHEIDSFDAVRVPRLENRRA
jgi:hypothetical protein